MYCTLYCRLHVSYVPPSSPLCRPPVWTVGSSVNRPVYYRVMVSTCRIGKYMYKCTVACQYSTASVNVCVSHMATSFLRAGSTLVGTPSTVTVATPPANTTPLSQTTPTTDSPSILSIFPLDTTVTAPHTHTHDQSVEVHCSEQTNNKSLFALYVFKDFLHYTLSKKKQKSLMHVVRDILYLLFPGLG